MIDPQSFRQTMSRFATGITVIATRDGDGKAVGLTVNSFTSVSLDPPLVSFCLDKRAHLFPLFKKADLFSVNILSENQQPVSQHFANFRKNPAPPRLWAKSQDDCPVLSGTLGWMLCRKAAAYKGGDHMIFLGEVIRLSPRLSKANPLIYFDRHYRHIAK